MQQQSILEAFHAAIRILIQSKVIFFLQSHPSPSNQRQPRLYTQFDCCAAITLASTISSLYQKKTLDQEIGKMSFCCLVLCQRERMQKKKEEKKHTHTTET